MNSEQELIVVEQLPIIKTYLEKLSVEIKEKVDKATSLVCTEENYKEIKEIRSALRKEFNELEIQRKNVKNAIMEKYNAFEEIYKEKVANLYKQADDELNRKITISTYTLFKEKEDKIRAFAEEHIKFNHLEDIIKFEDINLNINLSASIKSLKTKIIEFCEKISNDLSSIKQMEDSEELTLEYKKNNFELSKAILIVNERKEQLKRIKEREEMLSKKQEEEEKVIENVEKVIEEHEELTTPKEIIEDEEILTVQFVVKGTKKQILELKEWLKERGMYD